MSGIWDPPCVVNVKTKLEARTGFKGNNNIFLGDLYVSQDVTKNTYHGTKEKQEDEGKVGYFNFDLEILQGMIVADRRAQLKEMRTALTRDTASGARIVILVGMGGAGKTTLARLYTKYEKDESKTNPFFENLVWIDAEDPKNVVLKFKQILKDRLKMSCPTDGTDDQLSEEFYNVILKFKTLLVFDNVEKVEDMRKLLPKLVPSEAPPPEVIVTTRLKSGWEDYKDHLVHVRELSLEVCEVYIRETLAESPLKIPDVDDKWSELAEYFGGLVIALRAATVYIVEQNKLCDLVGENAYTLQSFMDEVKTVKLLPEDEDLNHSERAEVTYEGLRGLWTLTLNNLSSRPQTLTAYLAERILEVMAYMSPGGVPVRWFSILFAEISGFNSSGLMNAMSYLTSWSLVEQSGGHVSVHRVLQTTLLGRIKGKPQKRIETLDWLLPAVERLHSRLHAEKKLQNFFDNLSILIRNMETEVRGTVSHAVVLFLVNMNFPGMIACWRLLEQLVQNVYEKVAVLNRDSFKLLLASSSRPHNICLLLPDWIHNVSVGLQIEDRLRGLNNLRPYFYQQYPKVFATFGFYLAVGEVLEEWDPEMENSSTVQTAFDVIKTIKNMCQALSHCWYNDTTFRSTKLEDLRSVFSKLQKGLVTALKQVFRPDTELNKGKRRTMFVSITIVFKWYLALRKLQLQLVDMSELDSVLAHVGVDSVMVGWYGVQLTRYYSSCEKPSQMMHDVQIKLEARMIAAVLGILVTCLSSQSAQENQTMNVSDVPHLVLEFFTYIKSLYSNQEVNYVDSVVQAYLVYVTVEVHLDKIEDAFWEVTDSSMFKTSFQVFVKALKKISGRGESDNEKNQPKDVTFASDSLADVCASTSAENLPEIVEILFPKVQKVMQLAEKLFESYEETKLRRTIRVSKKLNVSDPNPGKLVDTLERYYERLSDNPDDVDVTDFRQSLAKTYEVALANANLPETLKNCWCALSRCQTVMAGMELKEGRTEAAIKGALEAFNHQLYCRKSGRMMGTVRVLLDAFSKCVDGQVRTNDLMLKLIVAHEEYPNDSVSEQLDSTKIRFLCSIGSILEASELSKKGVNCLMGPDCIHRAQEFLTVSLLLLVRGEKDRAGNMVDCLLQNEVIKGHLEIRGHLQFVQVLSTLAATSSFGSAFAIDMDSPVKEFRKGVIVHCEHCELLAPKVEEWADGRMTVEELFSESRRHEHELKEYGGDCSCDELDTLLILWFHTMESVLFEEPRDPPESLFEPLVRQMKLLNVGTEFRWNDFCGIWGTKCFVGMFQRKELWFQKSSSGESK